MNLFPNASFRALFNLCLLIICQTKHGWLDVTLSSETRESHSPRVSGEVFSLSMYHSCEWQTLIFKWKHVKVDFFFLFPHLDCVIFFIIRLFYSFQCVWLFCIYSMYMLRLLCMWCRFFFFVFDTRVHVLYIYLFSSHVHHSKNKKKEKLKTVRDL